jgi:lipoprotein-releasing system ATP-binding protein
LSAIVELKNVDKIYPGPVPTTALSDVNLRFEEKSFSSIVGASGSGKSSLLNIIGTLDTATNGEVLIDGNETSRLSRARIAELRNATIGFIFQFHFLLPEFTALENVLIPAQIRRGIPKKETQARADELFELVGVAKVKNNPSARLSGGQQQRVAVVRALINNPKIVLADEPTGNLDSENSALIYRIFREVNRTYGTTFIIVTHDRRIAEETDRIIEVKDGRIKSDIPRVNSDIVR